MPSCANVAAMATLVETIKGQVKEAMRAKDDVKKNVLRLVLGEIQLAESRQGKALDEEAGHKIVRKLVASNEATLEATRSPETAAQLKRENEVLLDLVPRQLVAEEIVEALAPVRDQIIGAKADGPAMGMAMKHLKSIGAAVEGDAVRTAVATIRAG